MTQEQVPQRKTYPKKTYPAELWTKIEQALKSGVPLKRILREMAASGIDVPTPMAVKGMARRRGWVSVEQQAENLARTVEKAVEIVKAEKDPVSRAKVVDRALAKLTVDELFRGHGESALDDLRTAMDRVLAAGESREIGPGEMAFAMNRLSQALAFTREAMEGKRPGMAVQINQGESMRPRTEVLIPSTMPRRST